ncbi:uncharacterized protein LOC107264498 isoform X2 [Cephus cinctus]|nr:uncharacterized protein LOC107264498 isoform X2 [Cephus cinctus]
MDFTIRNMMRMSMTFRNLMFFPNYVVSSRLFQTKSHYCTVKNQDKSFLAQTTHSSPVDNIIKSLRSCKNSSEIFNVIQNEHSLMTNRHIIEALTLLFNFQKYSSRKVNNIYHRQGFMFFCEVINKNLRNFDANEAVHALKVLSYLKIPINSMIMQSVLQLVRESINTLGLSKIIFLDFLIHQFEKTPLTEALSIALPIVFEVQVATQLDRNNIKHLASCLQYLSLRSQNPASIANVLDAILKFDQEIDIISACSILRSLCSIESLPDTYMKLVHNMEEMVSQKISEASCSTMMPVLSSVVGKINEKQKEFYHEGFLDACATAVISQDWGFEEGINVLSKLTSVGHTQIRLLDYLAAKCFENTTILASSSPEQIAILVMGLAIADYKPIFWESMQEAVVKSNLLERTSPGFSWVKFAVHLTSLDCFCPKVITKAFSTTINKKSNEKRLLLLLYQSVKALNPTYDGPWPPRDALEYAKAWNELRDNHLELLPALQKALGGSQYIISNVRTKLGHYINHVIVMRKGGYPVALNSANNDLQDDVIYMENLSVPAESQIILILCIPRFAYGLNSQRLTGPWSMLLKSMEAYTQHTVIPIHLDMWLGLPDHEKIPYLMQSIRLKCDDLSVTANM